MTAAAIYQVSDFVPDAVQSALHVWFHWVLCRSGVSPHFTDEDVDFEKLRKLLCYTVF